MFNFKITPNKSIRRERTNEPSIKEEVHTVDESDVKEEPISCTSDNEQIESATVSNSDVSMEQQTPTTTSIDYENDPEAGPSGLSTEPSNRPHGVRSVYHRYPYPHDSSDTDSDDDREIATSLWRSREAFNAKDRNRDLPWRLRPLPDTSFPEPSTTDATTTTPFNNTTDVVDLSGNDNANPVQDVRTPSPPLSSGIEILTAPDLQLDWVSDVTTDTDDDLICTTDLSPANRTEPLNYSTRLKREQIGNEMRPNEVPIDLTVSDEEEHADVEDNANEPIIDTPLLNIRPSQPRSRYESLIDQHHDTVDRGHRLPTLLGSSTYKPPWIYQYAIHFNTFDFSFA